MIQDRQTTLCKHAIIFLALLFVSVTGNGVKPSGSGTADDPYVITILDHLEWVTNNPESWDAYFRQSENIDAHETQNWNDGLGWQPIGTEETPFTGVYNGGGSTISEIFISIPEDHSDTIWWMGFFGILENARVDSLGLIDINMEGERRGGAVAAWAYDTTTISEVFATGNISGSSGCGGLVGVLQSESIIKNSFTHFTVKSADFTGGIASAIESGSTIQNCYITQPITNIVGWTLGALAAEGTDYTIENSVWDEEASGINRSLGDFEGMGGKSTDEMHTSTTFTELGWDFDSIWMQNDTVNDGYPHLQWAHETVGNSIDAGIPAGPLLRPSAKGIGIAGNIPHNTVLNLYTPAGRLVFSAPVGEAGSIPLPALSPGMYSAQLQAKGRGIAATMIRIE